MPTVEVYNGDLEGALAVFKQKVRAEGIVKERQHHTHRGKGNKGNRKERNGAITNDGNDSHS